jgi:hypothetical protein
VRLDVGDARARGPGDAVERGQLVQHVVGELCGVDVDEPAAEAGQVAVGDLRADRHPRGRRAGADPPHRGRVPGVEAAGDVRAGDQVEQGVVVPESPHAETLTEVGVEIDRERGHRRSLAPGPTA